MSANHYPLPRLCWSPCGTPLPLPAGFSRSLWHILSPHLSQHIKLSVLPQLHTRRCCHAKHRSARTPDCCWPAGRGELVGRRGERAVFSYFGPQCRVLQNVLGLHSISLGITPSQIHSILKPFTQITKQHIFLFTSSHAQTVVSVWCAQVLKYPALKYLPSPHDKGGEKTFVSNNDK